MRGKPVRDLARGEVLGCYTVKRASSPDDHYRKRYLVVASCCKREVVQLAIALLREPATCTKCKGRKKPAEDAHA